MIGGFADDGKLADTGIKHHGIALKIPKISCLCVLFDCGNCLKDVGQSGFVTQFVLHKFPFCLGG